MGGWVAVSGAGRRQQQVYGSIRRHQEKTREPRQEYTKGSAAGKVRIDWAPTQTTQSKSGKTTNQQRSLPPNLSSLPQKLRLRGITAQVQSGAMRGRRDLWCESYWHKIEAKCVRR